jgi:uncharacterized Zn finger protein (UPF0148 family)
MAKTSSNIRNETCFSRESIWDERGKTMLCPSCMLQLDDTLDFAADDELACPICGHHVTTNDILENSANWPTELMDLLWILPTTIQNKMYSQEPILI